MVAVAAVKINDLKQNKEITIKCHRHCNAYEMLKNFNYRNHIDYQVVEEGFLDENDKFLTRREAYQEAVRCKQLLVNFYEENLEVLFSEDIW